MTTIDWTKPIEDCRPGHEGEEATLLPHIRAYTRRVRFSNGLDWLTEDGKSHGDASPSVRNRPDQPPEHDFGLVNIPDTDTIEAWAIVDTSSRIIVNAYRSEDEALMRLPDRPHDYVIVRLTGKYEP